MADNLKHANKNAKAWFAQIEKMVEDLQVAEQDEDDRSGCPADEARQRIEESVLSVEVRSGWRAPGTPDKNGPEEYYILLSTGGPALRLVGDLGEGCEPITAEMQVQDWGTPWTRYPAPEKTLLAFARVFWFGE